MTATHHSSNSLAPLDGLPKPFVNAMRTLFDIMDDQRIGYVKFSEIERRWQDDGAQGLPRGVLGSLRKVTPSDGYLSFERFCAGLQISLLRNKMDDKPTSSNFGFHIPPKQSVSNVGLPPPPPPLSRPPSAPILDQDHHPKLTRAVTSIPSSSQASAAGSHHSRAERTVSMPHLDDVVSHSDHPGHQHYHQSEFRTQSSKPDIKMSLMSHSKSVGNMAGPPKPPRVMDRDRGTQSLDRNMENRNLGDVGRIQSDNRGTNSLERERSDRKWDFERSDRPHRDRDRNDHCDYRRERGSSLERLLDPEEKANHVPLGKAGIRSALQTWHKERRKGEVGDTNNNHKNYQEKDIRDMRLPIPTEPLGRGVGDGGDGFRTSGGNQAENHSAAAALSSNLPNLAPIHKKSTRKREARRHTLQNGIDYSLVRRLKQLEAERDMLVQGYEVVERARNWYRQQLQAVSERIHYLPQGPPQNEPSVEAQQEMLHFQLARIHEVNSHLRALMEASERGLPTHINLAIRPTVSNNFSSKNINGEPEEQGRVIERLKDQNHLLTEEVSLKSERITGLEREKAALLRELFQSRSTQQLQAASADSTFM